MFINLLQSVINLDSFLFRIEQRLLFTGQSHSQIRK